MNHNAGAERGLRVLFFMYLLQVVIRHSQGGNHRLRQMPYNLWYSHYLVLASESFQLGRVLDISEHSTF